MGARRARSGLPGPRARPDGSVRGPGGRVVRRFRGRTSSPTRLPRAPRLLRRRARPRLRVLASRSTRSRRSAPRSRSRPRPRARPILYHRVVVKSSCPTPRRAIVSNVVAVPVKTTATCRPRSGSSRRRPPNPPAFSTWVVSWNTLGTGPGPGGGLTSLKFRIRRTSALSSPTGSEWVVDGGAAVVHGRARANTCSRCGPRRPAASVGPWSPSMSVTVGNVLKPALLLVSEPAPIARLVPAAGTRPTTSFVVRNGGHRHHHRAREVRTTAASWSRRTRSRSRRTPFRTIWRHLALRHRARRSPVHASRSPHGAATPRSRFPSTA